MVSVVANVDSSGARYGPNVGVVHTRYDKPRPTGITRAKAIQGKVCERRNQRGANAARNYMGIGKNDYRGA